LLDLLVRCENAHLTLDPLTLSGGSCQVSAAEVQRAVKAHYQLAARRQLFSALGALSAFGNPVGLFRGFVQVR
jgi:hypothetical protein